MNRADLVYAICHLLGLRPKRARCLSFPAPSARASGASSTRRRLAVTGSFAVMTSVRGQFEACRSMNRHKISPVEDQLRALARERILVLDGAMGTMIQSLKLEEEEFRGARFDAWNREVRGNNDLLNLTQPDAIRDIHLAYLRAGADIVATNTFSSTAIAQADYGMEELAYELNLAGARLAHEAARLATRRGRQAALRRRRDRPDQPHRLDLARREQPGLPRRHVRPAARRLRASRRAACSTAAPTSCCSRRSSTRSTPRRRSSRSRSCSPSAARRVPVMISGTITDRSGRTLSGQTPEAFWNSVRHAAPLSIGLNCALGAKEMRAAHRRDRPRRRHAGLRLSECRPAERVRPLRREPGIHGGAARRVRRRRPRQHRRRLLRHDARAHRRDRRGGGAARSRATSRSPPRYLRLSGLEPFTLTPEIPFVNVGERTNVTGSAKFRKLVTAGDYAAALDGGARPGRERRAGHRRQHGRGPARFGSRHGRRSSTWSPPSPTSPACRSWSTPRSSR